MTPVRAALAAAVALALTAATSALTRTPVTFSGDDEGVLRLSWRMSGVTAQACRTLSEEELARLPLHMRNPRACIGVIAPYLLSVVADGTVMALDTVRPRGARGDRPLNVLRAFPLTPGDHRVVVSFHALLPDGVEAPAEEVVELGWEGSVRVAARDVALVTLDGTGRRLELRDRVP